MKVADFTGETLKELRKKHNLTQKELGERLGVKATSFSRWESGQMEMSIPYKNLFIEKLEKIYQISYRYSFFCRQSKRKME